MEEKFHPKVSIIIPVYNGSDFVAEAIESAINQSYDNIEIIVVNDGSNDEGKTREAVSPYQDKIRYFEKTNGGVATALNFGIEKMSGEYFSWLSHDDLYFPDKIQKQIKFLNTQQNKNIAVYSDFIYIDENSKLISRYKNKASQKNSLYAVIKGLINGCCLLIPKIFFKEQGLFDVSLKSTQDYDLWFRFFRVFPLYHLPLYLVGSRLHRNQGSKTISNHLDACNHLYSQIADEITKEETLTLEKTSALFYIKTAKHLKNVGYFPAAETFYHKYQKETKRYFIQNFMYKYIAGKKWFNNLKKLIFFRFLKKR